MGMALRVVPAPMGLPRQASPHLSVAAALKVPSTDGLREAGVLARRCGEPGSGWRLAPDREHPAPKHEPPRPCGARGRVADGHHVEIRRSVVRGPVSCRDCMR
jgi:hypothetical protein